MILVKISVVGKVFVIFISLCLSSIYGIKVTGDAFSAHVMSYATMQAKKVVTYACNNVVEQLMDKKQIKNAEIVACSESNGVKTINIDTDYLNTFLKEATKETLKQLKRIENGEYEEELFPDATTFKSKNGVIYEIPFALVTNNVILSNIGSKVPIRFVSLGSIESNIVSNTSSFGINNALINISLNMSISTQVVVPSSSKKESFDVELPIFMYVINGEIPTYYFGTKTVCSNIESEVQI